MGALSYYRIAMKVSNFELVRSLTYIIHNVIQCMAVIISIDNI